MAFLEERISLCLKTGTRGGPIASRSITKTASGHMNQDFRWSRPLSVFDAAYGVNTEADFEELRAFFYVVMYTPYEGFRLKDYGDYRFTKENSTLTFITGTTWQMQRVYTVASHSFNRKIVKPNADITVYRTRASVESVATTTYDTATGIVTMTGHASGDTYTLVGTFDVPVQFRDDTAFSAISFSGGGNELLPTLDPIMLEELRL